MLLTTLVDLSRWQFALTAMYHWLFVPLTLGLGFLIAFMETRYVMTGDEFWKRTTKFWMKLFAVNFAMGVATGIILEFEFGTNWSNYSWFVGDIFGAPAGHRGYFRIFHGKYLLRCDVFRLEQGQQEGPSGIDMAYGHRNQPLCNMDSHSQFLDAVSYRNGVQSGYGPAAR